MEGLLKCASRSELGGRSILASLLVVNVLLCRPKSVRCTVPTERFFFVSEYQRDRRDDVHAAQDVGTPCRSEGLD